MFIIDTRIKIEAGDYSTQSLKYAIENPDGAIFRALGRKLDINESVMFEGQSNGSTIILDGITIEQCPVSYWYDGTDLNERSYTSYCIDGGYLVSTGNVALSTPVNRIPGKILLPTSSEPDLIKMKRKDPGEATECLLMLCVNDNDPLLLEDRSGDEFATRSGFHDIPLLLNKGTGSLEAWKQGLHAAITKDSNGSVVRNGTDSEITIDFSVFKNVYKGKEVIFRLQSFYCTAPTAIYDFSKEDWKTDTQTLNLRKRVSYSGDIRRNPWRADGTDIVTGEIQEFPTVDVVSEITNKSYKIHGRAGALIDINESTFGFEDNKDYNYIDFFGTQSEPKFEVIVKDRVKFGASGDRALAQGKNVLAKGNQSFAQGTSTQTLGEDSVALGRWNEADPVNILEVGVGTKDKHENGLSVSIDGLAKLPRQEHLISDPEDIVVKGNLDTRLGSSDLVPGTVGAVPSYNSSGNLTELKGPHAISGEEYPYLQLNADGSVSAPCCITASINHPDDLITKAYFDAHNGTGTGDGSSDPISLPASLNVAGLSTEWDGIYTWNIAGYYRKGTEEKYILQDGPSVWVIGASPTVDYTQGICKSTGIYPHGSNQIWTDINNTVFNNIIITDAENKRVSPTISTSREVETSALVRSDNGYVTKDRILLQWADTTKRGEIDVMGVDSNGFAFKIHNSEKLLINTNGVITAPTASNTDIAASSKALITKEYADATYSDGGAGGAMLSYGFSRISWNSNGLLGPNGSNDLDGQCSHIVFRSGNVTQLSYYFEGHNTAGSIQLIVDGAIVYTSPSVPGAAHQSGLFNGLNVPVTVGQKMQIRIVGGGQRGQVTLVVEG